MNPVEIEQAVSELFRQPLDAEEFPYAFLRAHGAKDTTIKRLKKGNTNHSDIGGVLQRRQIHIKVAEPGAVEEAMRRLRASEATARHKVRFLLATDGEQVLAEDLATGDVLTSGWADFPDHFAFFLPLAGYDTAERRLRDNPIDIRAVSRLSRLYVELLKHDPDWAERRDEMNHFLARLIFCFFAEDTGIFIGDNLFTATVSQMSAPDGSDTHEIIQTLFRAMQLPAEERRAAGLPRWADAFPLVNGWLFAGSVETPRFSRAARTYLLQAGELDWSAINPDIFGSMIQTVTDEEHRGDFGLHYTSVPNIMRVLGPLFLDELKEKLEAAGDNRRKLLNLRRRLANIRVFDPACGSGNFLVIAYKALREIEAEINARLGEPQRPTGIRLTNFRGIELLSFPAEVARLALIIAEYQANVQYRGKDLALAEFLPLNRRNWITTGNALRLNWLSICPPLGREVQVKSEDDDLFATPLEQPEIAFETRGGELYICGNPPYLGSTWQSKEQKEDLKQLFDGRVKNWRSLDYVCGWFLKAADYLRAAPGEAASAFVSTNSICQGQQVGILWPAVLQGGVAIHFAHTSFRWKNLARHNAGVTVIVAGLKRQPKGRRRLFITQEDDQVLMREVDNINAYLVAGPDIIVHKAPRPINGLPAMDKGNQPTDGGHLLLTYAERRALGLSEAEERRFIRRIYGSREFINNEVRYCLWIRDADKDAALAIPAIAERVEKVRQKRLESRKAATRKIADIAHKFGEIRSPEEIGHHTIVVPEVSSENRYWLPVGIVDRFSRITNKCFALYDAPLWNLALLASRLHLVWIATVCGRLKTDFSYSNTLGWHTFPVPRLTTPQKQALTAAAERILLARAAHFPASLADLYKSLDAMPEELRTAHEHNDELIERITIGRRFTSDSERLEKLLAMYEEMMRA